MDGTVDVSGTDQQNIIVRFVSNGGKIHERLLEFEIITFGKGEALWDLVSEKLKAVGLQITSLIEMSLDDASANRSENAGVVKFYRDEVPVGFLYGILLISRISLLLLFLPKLKSAGIFLDYFKKRAVSLMKAPEGLMFGNSGSTSTAVEPVN